MFLSMFLTTTYYLGCAPERLWFVSRHGTRYPNEKKIRSIKKKLPTVY